MEELEQKLEEESSKKGFQTRLKDWAIHHVTGARAKFWLATLSFAEASFFVVPPDVLLIAVLGVNAQRWLYYASFTTIFSVLGGIVGYLIGFFFFDLFGQSLVDFYHLVPLFSPFLLILTLECKNKYGETKTQVN